MPVLSIVPAARRDADATARGRTVRTIRRAIVLLGTIGLTASAALVITSPALASVGSQPGNLKFSPASGGVNVAPSWSTTTGCPPGYQGSAQVSVFNQGGTLLSRISNVDYQVTSSFSGTLQGSMSAILNFANVGRGGSLEFAVGCYSQTATGGKVKWLQSTLVTLSSDGKSFTSSSPAGQHWTTAGHGGEASPALYANGNAVNATPAADAGSGLSGAALGGLIAAACALAAGAAGLVWYRRRNRSRLM